MATELFMPSEKQTIMGYKIRSNAIFGVIGYGCTVKSALNEMTMIAEGYFAAECIKHINEKHGVDMPIADMVYDVLYKRVNPRRRMKELTDRL